MAISRARKEELVALYAEQLAQSDGIIFAHYTGLTVPQMQDLRRRVREVEGLAFVVKNTLLQRALTEKGISVPEGFLTGPMIVGFCHQDAPPVAKAFREFAKEMEEGRFILRGAVVDGTFYDEKAVLRLADLPSREQLLAQVLATINAPATQTVSVIASGIRQVLNVLQAYVDKLEEEGNKPAEAAA